MNVFSYLLAEGDIDDTPDVAATKFAVDDNVGESIHIHYRNTRWEFSVDDFRTFGEACEEALEALQEGGDDGDR